MKKSFQNHTLLAKRLKGMVHSLNSKPKLSDEEKKYIADLEEQISEHKRKARLFGPKFIMIL